MTKVVSLRMSQELHDKIAKMAKDDERSINSMIVLAIKKYVKGNK
jgi:hypothetical protein